MEIDRYTSAAYAMYNLYHFFMVGCVKGAVLFCKTNQRKLKAEEMFVRMKNYIFVRADSLPFDRNVKALGLNFMAKQQGGRLYAELSRVDWNLAREKLGSPGHQYDSQLSIRGNGFYWGGTRVIASNTRVWFKGQKSPRTLLYTFQDVREIPVEPLVYAVDLLHGGNCFRADNDEASESSEASGAPAAPSMRQEQRQEQRQLMVQQLNMEQRPLMIMTLRQQANLFQRQRVLGMNSAELARYVQDQVGDNPLLKAD